MLKVVANSRLIIAVFTLLALATIANTEPTSSSSANQRSDKAPAQQVAHLKPTKGYFVTDIGKDAFRVGDSVVLINGEYLTAKGKIEGVDDSSSVGKFTGIWTRSFKEVDESEIYVINRTDSPCSLVSANLDVAKIHADFPSYDPKTVPREDRTGEPISPVVLNINGSVDVINVGKSSCRINDTLLVVRISDRGPYIVGTLKVVNVYAADAITFEIHNWGGIRPEDYIFVINRANSDISLAKISLAEK